MLLFRAGCARFEQVFILVLTCSADPNYYVVSFAENGILLLTCQNL